MSRLRRIARQAAARAAPDPVTGRDGRERCDLCAEPLPPDHRHLLDLSAAAVRCACRACALLFDRREAGGASYRLLPRERRRLDGCAIDEVLWAGLGIPVDLAFFVRGGATGEVTAGYPSPLGTLRAAVHPDSWRELTRAHPALPGLADDVEALLVHRAGGAREHWLVPLDDCYRLVAVVRAHWKGLGGGPEVWRHVDTFFSELAGELPGEPAGEPSTGPATGPDPGPRPTPQEASWVSP
ncbi:DUF5947 family protein [Streptomyces sp. LX-29]|uniref:DUF5947 family protein n=1 Tax=Streptomyces sp. LX-29 TaxID=2900152 RepID=UPI00240D37C9|nr:DUF5947 family protein [Streptomyces sp. LX-29]WFB06360.1 DUF5947 family protein [Streptomyces sp. LX-29]